MVDVAGETSLQTEVLEDLSCARRYRRWLADLVAPYLGRNPIEVGSGTGDYALEWVGRVDELTVTEGEPSRLRALAERFRAHDKIRVRHLLLGNGAPVDLPGEYSAAVALNVLEHIPDDVGALRAMASLVKPGGAVALIVPAFPFAMSEFDRRVGHQRRYTRESLENALVQAGLRVTRLRYVNPLGLLGWYTTVKVLGIAPRNGRVLRTYDRWVVPVARALDRLAAPFGQSVFAVARVPGTEGPDR